MHATIRRYEGVDQNRTEELTRKVEESLLPQLSKLDGFSGYYLVEAGNGVITSISFFDTATQGDESTRLSSSWLRDQGLETIVPNAPKVTSGEIIAHERALVPVA